MLAPELVTIPNKAKEYWASPEGQQQRKVLRAIAAYYRGSGIIDKPAMSSEQFHAVNGKEYVALRNGSRILKVYRVLNSGKLKSLKIYPKELEL